MADYAILCGLAGEANALENDSNFDIYCSADGIAKLKTTYRQYKGLISWGTAGGLTPGFNVGDLVIADLVTTLDPSGQKVVTDADVDWTYLLLTQAELLASNRGVTCHLDATFSASIIASTPVQRAQLHAQYDGVCIDEETATVVELATSANIPFVAIRVISDDYRMTIPSFAKGLINSNGTSNLDAAVKEITSDPADISAMLKYASCYAKALESLVAFHHIGWATMARIG